MKLFKIDGVVDQRTVLSVDHTVMDLMVKIEMFVRKVVVMFMFLMSMVAVRHGLHFND